MTSTSWNDKSCMEAACKMSCEAMIQLAKKDMHRNNEDLEYNIMNPNCGGYSKLKNVSVENDLINTEITRNLCYTHDPVNKTGPYFAQLLNIKTPNFDENTKRKNITIKTEQNGIKQNFTPTAFENDIYSSYYTLDNFVKDSCQ